uniref:Protein aurora borealis n=1 Tax=Parastrongyloides trichosuri TaxID=131310 RepID=A0A0N4ZH30_PARTI
MNYPREFDDILYNSDGLLSKSILNQSRRFRQPKRKSDSMFDDQLFKQAFNAPFFQRTTSSFVRDAIPKEFMNTGFDRLFPLTSGHDNTFVNSFRQEHRPIRETQSFRIPSINDSDEEQFFRNRNSSTSSNGVVRNIPIRFMDDQNVRSFNESFNDDYLSFENNVSQQRSDLLNNDFMENNSQSRPFFNNTMYGSAPKSIRRTKSSGQVSPPLFGIWNDFLDHKDIDNNIDRKGPIDIQNVTKPKVPPKPVSLSKSMFSSNDFNQNNRKNSLHHDNYIPNNISNTEKLKDNTEMKFIPRIHQKLKKEDSIDEAIRSLEMLEINPQKYVSYTNSNDIEKNDNKNSQHLDDSSLDSPSSSGIVGDLSDEEKKRSSVNLKYQILSKPNEILGHDNHNRDSFYETLPATLHKPVLSKTAGLTEQTKIIVPMENGNTLTIPLVTNNGIYTNMSESTENINSNYPTNYSKNISLKSE